MVEYRDGDPIPGTQYRFVRELGAGGHGSVYAVEHTFLEAPAVMKLLHAELVDRGELAQRMVREARTLAKLRHPNIVEVKDGGMTGESPPRPFFVMESLSGMPLRDLLRRVPGGIGVLPALRVMIEVFEGLEHAHRAGVVHRDIKPDNIFLHRTNTGVAIPKILDFGIAHLLLGHRFTGKYFLGTPRYAAPEQLRGDSPTARTDIYAAGLVLYELLTGEAPFAHLKDIGALLNAHLNEPLPKVSSRCAEATLLVDNVVASLLEKDPDERPPTAFAAAVILREVRSRFEASQAESMHAPEFKTEPSPMDRLLYEASPDDSSVVTEAESRPGGGVNDTIPERPPLPQSTSPLGGATLPHARPPSRTVPLAPARSPAPGAPPITPASRGAQVDREARTRTSREPARGGVREANDTEPLGRDHPAMVDTAPASTPPVPATRERPRGEERTPAGVAMPVRRRDDPHDVASSPARRRRRPVPKWLVAALFLVAVCAMGVPLALYTSQRTETAPPRRAAAPPPPATASAVVPSVMPSSSSDRAEPRAPVPLASTVAPPSATIAPRPPAAAPLNRPGHAASATRRAGDPSAVGWD